jgi:amino acid adenylation domain-containing protein/FkbM family methyltransferase
MKDNNESLDALKEKILMQRLEKRMRETAPIRDAIPQVDRTSTLPMSFQQQRLWFIDKLDPAAGTAYLIPIALRLSGALDRQAFGLALDRMVERHEVLRTSFLERDGMPAIAIASPSTRMPLREIDISQLQPEVRDARLKDIIDSEVAQPFDLATAPLVRCRLIRVTNDMHVVVFVQHHIVSDGWSLGILVNEFATVYAKAAAGQELSEPSPILQYADYAAWQRASLDKPSTRVKIESWRRMLADAPALLALPLDRPRPSRQSFQGAQIAVVLEKQIVSAVRLFALKHEITTFNVLLMGWAILLSRLSGQRDVVIGVPAANRIRRELEGLIGFFVNTLALRVDMRDDPSVGALIAQVRDSARDAQASQHIPFEMLVDALKPTRTLAHSPIFQTALNFDNTPTGKLSIAGLQIDTVAVKPGTTHFDIALALQDDGERIAGRIDYATDLFDEETVLRWARHYSSALRSLTTAADDAPVSSISILDRADMELVIRGFNATSVVTGEPLLIHRLFEQQAARSPEAVAVEFDGNTLTYAELDARANQLALFLRHQGCGPDVIVGIGMERSLEIVIAQIAVLKAGAAFLPLDPSYPIDRLIYMLEDADPPVLLTQASLIPLWPERSGRLVVSLDRDWEEVSRDEIVSHDSTSAEPRALSPDHLAYVIYTSGSSGRPKGVMVHHRGIANHMLWLRTHHPMSSEDILIQKTPFSFDASVWDFFSALICGAKLLIAAPKRHFDVDYLIDLIVRGRVTRLKLVPTLLRAMLDHPRMAECVCLRDVFSGGEALPYELAQRFFEVLPGTTLYNHYGPTETSVNVTYGRCLPGDHAGRAPIGRPIANTRIYIVDQMMRPLPIGAPGEMLIGGIQVARGYLNRPDLTQERFITDPIDPNGGPVYRSGDLCRWLADGSIEYLGRNDFQVKIRGFRIELGEIEAQLLDHTDVREAAVLAREDTPGDPRLVAYIVCHDGGGRDITEIRDHVAAKLPDYMVPAAIVRIAAMPLTPNGKLDRNALPAPDRRDHSSREFVAPQTATESRVADVWRDFLGVERVGRDDGFFELGGHSMMAIRVVAKLRSQGDALDVRTLFANPVLRAFCAVLDDAGSEPKADKSSNTIPLGAESITPEMLPLAELSQEDIDRIVSRVDGGAAAIQDIYRLAPLQEGILFHHLAEEAGDPYLSTFVLEFPDRNGLARFSQALRSVVARHDILRTSIHWKGLNHPVQVVHRTVDLQVKETRIPHGESPATWLSRLSSPSNFRFDLNRAPLIALHAAPDATGGGWYLAVVNHHMISDHITLELLLGEVAALLDGRADELPLPRPFRDHIAAITATPETAHKDYFSRLLKDVKHTTAPFGIEKLQAGMDGVCEGSAAISYSLARRIRAQARAMDTSPAILFHVAWAQVVARTSGHDDVVFGTVLSGRMGSSDSDAMLGVFINTLPFRFQLDGRDSARAVYDAATQLSELMMHESASLALAQNCSGIRAPQPLFTSLLNYRRTIALAAPHSGSDDWNRIRILFMEERTNYPLSMSVNDEGDGFTLVVHCAREIDPVATAQLLETAMNDLIDRLELDSEAALCDLEILTSEARERLLGPPLASEPCLPSQVAHCRFLSWAERTPDAIALTDGDTALTYAELGARALRVAEALAADGVFPGDLVGLCTERGTALVVGLLGIAIAGGAYVPLDPVYPPERLTWLIGDTAPVKIVADAAGRSALAESNADVSDIYLIDGNGPSLGTSVPRSSAGNFPIPDVDAPAYVIHTSGSTGKPKGVPIRHAQVARLLEATSPIFEFGERDVWTLFHSYAFDFSVWELWGALAFGGRLVIVPASIARSPADFHALLCRERVTVLNQTPSAFRALIPVATSIAQTHHLRLVIFGGEALDYRMLSPWMSRTSLSTTRLVNMYGITEITVHATVREVNESDISGTESPVGRALPHLRIYVLDARGRLVPAGVPGEIHVAGHSVAQGYLNRDALTAERFVADPFSPGSRMYRTGDIGRWRGDGDLVHLGRNDAQIKIRGHRIEPGEIDAVLSDQPGVAEVRVLAREFGDDDRRLVAYVAPSPDSAPQLHRLLALEDGLGAGHPTCRVDALGEIFHLNASETHFLHGEIFHDDGYLRHGVVLSDGDCVFDVGANIGMFAMFAASRRSGLRIFAFEPIPQVCDALRLNMALLGIEAKVFDCGVSDAPGEADFVFYPHNSVVSSSVLNIESTRAVVAGYLKSTYDATEDVDELLQERMRGERLRRPLRTVSEIIRENDVRRIDLLKIDVEGAEWQVLAGIESEHWPLITQVVLEVHDIDGRLNATCALLTSLGFSVATEQDQALAGSALHNVYAVRHMLSAAKPFDTLSVAESDVLKSRDGFTTLLSQSVGSLPAYMRPSHYVFISSFPLTHNGKLDVGRLPMPGSRRHGEWRRTSPIGPVEETLAMLWREILHVEDVAREDDFFALGGHSLSAVQLSLRLRERHGLRLSIRDMFRSSVLYQMAESILDREFSEYDVASVSAAEAGLNDLDEATLLALLDESPSGTEDRTR